MAESTLSRTWGGIRRTLAGFGGFTRDESRWNENKLEILNESLLAGIQRVYLPDVQPGDEFPHIWSWIRPVTSITVRPEATGTLSAVLSPTGSEWIIQSVLDVFTATMVDLTIQFDDSGAQYKIVEFVSTTRVLAKSKAPVTFANIPTGTVVAVGNEGTGTDIVATTAKFASDMVGDTINFTSGSSYTINQFHSTTKVTVAGDASSESGTFNVERIATATIVVATAVSTLPVTTFRDDMADDSDTITFTLTSNVYTITNVSVDLQSAIVTPNTSGLETDGDTFTIKKLLTSSSTTFLGKTLVQAAAGTFEQSMVGQFLRFDAQPYNTYLIEDLRSPDGDFVRVAGHAAAETSDFKIVENVGTVTGAIVYDGTSSIVNITAANFTSTMVGMVLIFQKSGNEYAITSFTDTTTVIVAGNAGGEATQDDVFVVGPGTESSGAAFALLGGSGFIYDLSSDFGGMIGNMTYDPGTGSASLKRISPTQILEQRQVSSATGRPQVFATRPKSVTTTTNEGQRHEILFGPDPNSEYTFNYQYLSIPNLPDSFDHFPLGGPYISGLILMAAKASLDASQNDNIGVPEIEFVKRLAALVGQDRITKGATVLGMIQNPTGAMTASTSRALGVGNIVVQGTEIIP